MGSFAKLMALSLFGATGVGIAVFVATSPKLATRNRTSRAVAKVEARGEPVATAGEVAQTVPPAAKQAMTPTSSAEMTIATPALAPPTEPTPAQAVRQHDAQPDGLRFPNQQFASQRVTAPAVQQPQPPTVAPPAPVLVAQQTTPPLPPDPRLPPPAGAPAPAAADSMSQLGELGKVLLEQINAQNAKPPRLPPGPSQPFNAGNNMADEEGEDEEGDPLPAQPRPSSAPSSLKITKLPRPGDDRLSVHIQNKDLREVLDFLGEHGGLSILAGSNVQGAVSVSLTDVTIDEALAAILKSTGFVARREGKFIYVGTPKDIQMMAQSIDRIGTRVYRPNYVKAAELQPLILPLLTPAGSAQATSGASASATVAVSPPSQIGIAPDNSSAGGDTFAQGEVLLVRDFEAVLAEIDQVVAEIDKRPMQVAIEAMLLSVELKDTNNFGVDFAFLNDHVLVASGNPVASLGDIITDGGLKVGFLDSSLGVFLSALQTIGDTNVIATPRLMCLNKHKAEILIGAQLGYVTKTLTQTTTTQAVEFLEVGTQLRLRPFISSDGLIRMEVHPEISTGSVDVVEGFTLPNKQVTQVTTNIMVRDGCTVVIGGLMQEQLAQTGSQIPLFGSLPGVGWLFRNRKGSQTRNEIIVLITPHIVYEPESCIEGDKAACEFHRQHAVYKDQMTPLNSRYLGRKFFRLAQNAWAVNDKRAAMRFINLAIHFDPQNRASINLRSDIVAGNHFGDHTGPLPVPVPTADPAEAFDGAAIAPWVLDDLEHPASAAPLHPRDPGHMGRVIKIHREGSLP
jgi:type IV pilus assembly protein PilQ